MTKKNYLLSTIILAGLVAGCAKDRAFDELYKESGEAGVRAKSELDTTAEFLYVPTSQGVPRFTKAMAPFVQGKERIIKFKFEEDAIVAYQMEKNPSFTDNTLNNKPILKIPVEYKNFRCAENDNGECTNREEENTELEWFQKDKFVADYSGVEVLEADSLDLPTSSDPCFSPIGDKLIKESLKLTKTDLNFTIEKTYQFSNSPGCVEDLWYSSNGYQDFLKQLDKTGGAFKTRVHYSFARLDSIASKNYVAIDYPVEDHGIFGFFTTSEEHKNSNGQNVDSFVLNRWNPEKKVIEYYLSDEFSKPENKYLKVASYFAFDRMNKALERDGVNLRLNLNEPAGKNPGDLRNTMVVLIEDIASNLLGYGPTVANPRTGEIVKGHTNMYKGSLESYAPYTYDSIVFLEKQIQNQEEKLPAAIRSNKIAKTEHAVNLEKQNKEELIHRILDLTGKMIQEENKKSGKLDLHNHAKEGFTLNTRPSRSNLPKMSELKKIQNMVFEKNAAKALLSKFKDKDSDFYKQLSKDAKIREILHKNVYTSDMFNFQSLGKASVKEINNVAGIRNSDGTLKLWIELKDEQKRELTQILARHAYVPTLIHEIGHNLGLRHNFEGSVDKDNFYSKEDREELKIEGGSVYSSIMDYAYSSLNELSTFGRYDTAALKFAYNREVELKDGTIAKVEGVDQNNKFVQVPLHKIPSLREFKFCTDENAGSSLTCNRFDEGVNELEIMNHYVAKHAEEYAYKNVKNRSRNFNDNSGARRYLVNTFYTMIDVRQIHEGWQALHSYLSQFRGFENLAITGCTVEQRDQLGDFCDYVGNIAKANDVAGRFFLDIIKSPDLTCNLIINGTLGDEKVIENLSLNLPLSNFMDEMRFKLPGDAGFYKPSTCFDKNIVPVLKAELAQQFCQRNPNCVSALTLDINVAGEAGKLHNDVAAVPRKGEVRYTGDLEVRGNWIEKAFAMEFLVSKDLWTTSGAKLHLSYVDHPVFKKEIQNVVEHLLYGAELENPIEFTAKNGTKYPSSEPMNLNAKTKVPRLKETISNFIPLKDKEDFSIGPVLTLIARKNSFTNVSDAENEEEYLARNEFYDSLNGYSTSLTLSSDSFGGQVIETFKDQRFAYGATARNTVALKLIKNLNGDLDKANKEIKAITKKLDDDQIASETPAPAPGDDSVNTDTVSNSQAAVQKEDDDTQAKPKEPTAGKEALEKIVQIKEMENIVKVEVEKFVAKLMTAQTEEDFTKIIEGLSAEIGVIKAQMVLTTFFSANDPEMSQEEQMLMEFDLASLKYALADDAGKVEVKKAQKAGLFNLL